MNGVADIPIDAADTPVEGSQWLMDWELAPEQRAKAGIPDRDLRILDPQWKKLLDAVDHGSSSTSS